MKKSKDMLTIRGLKQAAGIFAILLLFWSRPGSCQVRESALSYQEPFIGCAIGTTGRLRIGPPVADLLSKAPFTNHSEMRDQFAYAASRYSHLSTVERSGSLQVRMFGLTGESGFDFAEAAAQSETSFGITYNLTKNLAIQYPPSPMLPQYADQLANCDEKLVSQLGDSVIIGVTKAAWAQLNFQFHFADTYSGKLRSAYFRTVYGGTNSNFSVNFSGVAQTFLASRSSDESIGITTSSSNPDLLLPTPDSSVLTNLDRLLSYLDSVKTVAITNSRYVTVSTFIAPITILPNYPFQCALSAPDVIWQYADFHNAVDWVSSELFRLKSWEAGAVSWLNSEGFSRLKAAKASLESYLKDLRLQSSEHFRTGGNLQIDTSRFDQVVAIANAVPHPQIGILMRRLMPTSSFEIVFGVVVHGTEETVSPAAFTTLTSFRPDGREAEDDKKSEWTVEDIPTLKSNLKQWLVARNIPDTWGGWPSVEPFLTYLETAVFVNYFAHLKKVGARARFFALVQNDINAAPPARPAPQAIGLQDSNATVLNVTDLGAIKTPTPSESTGDLGSVKLSIMLRPVLVITSNGSGPVQIDFASSLDPAVWSPLTSLTVQSSPFYYTDISATNSRGIYRIHQP